MTKKKETMFVLGDVSDDFSLLDADTYLSKDTAIDYATEVIDECEEEASVTVYQLVPVAKVSKPKIPAVTVEDL